MTPVKTNKRDFCGAGTYSLTTPFNTALLTPGEINRANLCYQVSDDEI